VRKAIMIFIDGLGLGKDDMINPLVTNPTPGISRLLGGRSLVLATAGFRSGRVALQPVDATLGVEGRPQSATGQASLFTGINASRLLGRHQNAFPGKKLKALLQERGLFQQLKRSGLRGTFANAYRPLIFKAVREGMPGGFYPE